MVVGNGKNTNFWHDKWCGQVSLKDKFPQLYEINLEQNCSVSFNKEVGASLLGGGFMKSSIPS